MTSKSCHTQHSPSFDPLSSLIAYLGSQDLEVMCETVHTAIGLIIAVQTSSISLGQCTEARHVAQRLY